MEKYLKKLTKQMKQFAENFQYEKAAQIRDEIQQIKERQTIYRMIRR